MKYGISAAALIVQEGRLLLVRHREAGKYDFWVPPGGGLRGSESILDCARRETREETGLAIEPGRVLYIQEFWDSATHFVKFFVLGRLLEGELTLSNRDPDEAFLVEARFLSRSELRERPVYPEVLKDAFWKDYKAEPPVTRYLGIERLRF